MAIAATGVVAERNATGTRTVISQGDVLLNRTRFVLAWCRASDLWIGLPIAMQRGPFHRTDVAIFDHDAEALFGPLAAHGRVLIRTGSPEPIAFGARLLCRFGAPVLARVAWAVRHGIEADTFEGVRYG